MTKKIRAQILACLVLVFIFIFPFLIVSAAPNLDYTPMETLPGFAKTADFATFISNLYKFGIWVVGICALTMIVIGGYMYAASGGNNASMEKAKGFITDAIVGLILALLAYLILYIINPELVKIKLSSVSITPAVSAAPATIPPSTGLTPAEKSACSLVKNNQQAGQCADASQKLNALLDCMNKEFGEKMQISSISDSNGGSSCYQNHPDWPKCTATKKTYCCFHTRNSCHYGGPGGGKSCAVDFSKNSAASLSDMEKYARTTCEAGYAKVEENPLHLHVSVPGCDCN